MLRLFTCAAMAMLIGAGVGLADEKKAPKKGAKKGSAIVGQVISYEGGTLKVRVRKEEKEYKISDDTPVLEGAGKKATKLTSSIAKEKLAKKGTRVRITLNKDGSVKQVNIVVRKPK